MVQSDEPNEINGVPLEQIKDRLSELDPEHIYTDGVEYPVHLEITTEEPEHRVRAILEDSFTVIEDETVLTADNSFYALQVNAGRF
jgi:hypothetical protein